MTLFTHLVFSQSEKTFQVSAQAGALSQHLRASFPLGSIEMLGGLSGNVMYIYGKQQQDNHDLRFSSELQGQVQQTNFSLYPAHSDLASLQGSNGGDYWKLQFNASLPVDLDLSFGLGDAYLDFTGLKIPTANLKIGRSAVRVLYKELASHPTKLFDAKIDAGELHVDKLNLGNIEKFQAEIGFGALNLHFSDRFASNCHALVNVGAGKLYVKLPSVAMPIQVKIDKSILSKVSIPEGLVKVGEGLYATPAFISGVDGHKLYFDISVSMGTVNFSF